MSDGWIIPFSSELKKTKWSWPVTYNILFKGEKIGELTCGPKYLKQVLRMFNYVYDVTQTYSKEDE